MERVWVAALVVSDATKQKIINVHHLHIDEVADAVVCQTGLVATWHDHPERGRRLIVQTLIRGRRALIVLYPTTEPDKFHLGSAYFT